MNEELLNEALIGLIKSVKSTKDFVLEQSPEVIQQLILWKITQASIHVFIGSVLLTILAVLTFKLFNVKHDGCRWDDNDPRWISIAPALSFIGIGFYFVTQLLFLLKIHIAPKLYIIEYITNLVS